MNMGYEFKVTRLEKIVENGEEKGLVIGVTCTNTENNRTAYVDWVANKDEFSRFPPSKDELNQYVDNYLNKEQENGKSIADGLKEQTQNEVRYEPLDLGQKPASPSE